MGRAAMARPVGFFDPGQPVSVRVDPVVDGGYGARAIAQDLIGRIVPPGDCRLIPGGDPSSEKQNQLGKHVQEQHGHDDRPEDLGGTVELGLGGAGDTDNSTRLVVMDRYRYISAFIYALCRGK